MQKAIHLTLWDFHEIFEVGMYIQKAWHFALRDIFIYKKLGTSQKARQFAIRFYIQKSGSFALRNFSLNFWNLRRGGGILLKKIMYFALHFYIEKQFTLRYVAMYKEPDTMRYILISKKQYTFHYVYIYIIYSVVLIPNYKRTYDQSYQIQKNVRALY